MKRFFYLLLLIAVLSGCRTPRTIQPVLPSVINSSFSNSVTSGGENQQGYTKSDSASLKALVACDSLGNVYIRQIAALQMGHNVKPSIEIRDNYIYLKCEVDSLAVYNKWLRFYDATSDTASTIQYLPGTVTNELSWTQKLMIKLGWLFVASIVTFLIYLMYKIKFK